MHSYCSTCFKSTLISYWFNNLGFLLRENLLLHSSYLPLGVSQRACVSRAIKLIFWRHCWGVRVPSSQQPFGVVSIKLLQGESHTSNLFYFVFVLLSLLLLCVVCFLYQKSKKISYLLFILSFRILLK